MEPSEVFAAEIDVDIVTGCLEGWLNPDLFPHLSPELKTVIRQPNLVWQALRFERIPLEHGKKVLLHLLKTGTAGDLYECLNCSYLTPDEVRPAALTILLEKPTHAANMFTRQVITEEELHHYVHIVASNAVGDAISFYTIAKVISREVLKPYLIEAGKKDRFAAYEYFLQGLLTKEEYVSVIPHLDAS